MDGAGGRAYEDFEPPHKMVRELPTHILSVNYAVRYKKEHIKVQLVNSRRLLVVSGECPVAGNRWSRFRLELPVPDGCEVKAIHARFENGVVRVTMPGLREQEPPAKTGAAVAGEATADQRRATTAAKDGGPGAVGDQQLPGALASPAPASPPRGGGYHFLQGRGKLATSLVGVVLVLFSFVIYVRYSVKP
ncbi:hypothetical protein E2562_024424 [Oryza meyeriana var. granulata]|uniref:SHSP domain-containing protein n=1 Tax=Oryza meyeriana var. granulata TaxID=110450 RepID=A0A6G1EYT7_9ORYZ|nr:hypothetical protein E2562_024424 [Oryza meyeriana var. granulata]